MRLTIFLIALALLSGLASPERAAAQAAREVFGAIQAPAGERLEPVGAYNRGCIAGAVALPLDGPHWQSMRRERNKYWGHPNTIRFLERLSAAAAANDNWRGLLLGDISQPRGGPAVGHSSHQIGLDTDIYLTEMPEGRLTAIEREELDMPSLLAPGTLRVDERRWRPEHLRLIRRAALDGEVERIFVHPGIKRKLCETAGGDRSWLRKVRPTYGHDYHFHVRLECPAGSRCEPQEPVPAAEGCDASLQWWFDVALQPPPPNAAPARPRPLMQLSALPDQCVSLARAPAGAVPSFAAASAAAAAPLALPDRVPVPTTRPFR